MRLTVEQVDELESVAVIGYDGSVSSRARMVLWSGEGLSVSEIAQKAGTTGVTVRQWLARWQEGGLAVLQDRRSPGRPRVVSPRDRARIVALTRQTPPGNLGISHWSTQLMSGYLSTYEDIHVSHNFVVQLWRAHQLAPHRLGTHKLSKDPDFAVKVTDIVGLYLDPPDGAVVLSFDEKTQVQALDRTQPLLPLSFGRAEQRTHDYLRHGTTNLFAALDVGTGKVTTDCFSRRRRTEFLVFMDRVIQAVPAGRDVHVIVDNLSTHKGDDVSAWLTKNPKVRLHYTPTGSSWLNHIEIWLNIITKQAIRRGTFSSVFDLIKRLRNYTDTWNTNSKPFCWTATATEILEKVAILESDYKKLLANNNF